MDQKTRTKVAQSLRTAAKKLSANEDSPWQAPQVNNNGTSKKELMNQLLAVAKAGREMQRALDDAAPHGRDYQTLPPMIFQLARTQHTRRAQSLARIMEEIEDIALQVQDQGRD